MSKGRFLIAGGLCCCLTVLAHTTERTSHDKIGVTTTMEFINSNISRFTSSTIKLDSAIKKINKNDPSSISNAIDELKKCRMQYKKIEFFLSYFYRTINSVFNDQPNYEVEEPFYEYKAPSGFQVIAAILFSKHPYSQKDELLKQANLVTNSAKGLYSLLYTINITDNQILESIRLGIIRLIALGMTGYDSQELKTGIVESGQVLSALKEALKPYLLKKYDESDSVSSYLNMALQMVKENSNFDSFDRMKFLTSAIFPLQHNLGELIKQEKLELNTTGGILDYDTQNFFSPGAILINPNSNPDNLPIFPAKTDVVAHLQNNLHDSALVKLGKILFSETALSGNYSHSCTSCHQPDKYFTDGLPKGIAYSGMTKLKRNTPTLLYASFQYSQFWDGRANSLDSQIRTVFRDPEEMHSSYRLAVDRLRHNKFYANYFRKLFPEEKDTSVNLDNITLALSSYIESLSPFNSPFDQYM